MLQPEWRKDSIEGSLIFCHDVPIGETWQGMRKGGTAGIYIIVMALSWWIKAQKAEHDVEAWSTITSMGDPAVESKNGFSHYSPQETSA